MRSYVGLRNVVTLTLAVFYFLAVVLGEQFQLRVLLRKVLEKAKRFFEVPGFKYCALADGIHWMLSKAGPRPPPRLAGGATDQMILSFAS